MWPRARGVHDGGSWRARLRGRARPREGVEAVRIDSALSLEEILQGPLLRRRAGLVHLRRHRQHHRRCLRSCRRPHCTLQVLVHRGAVQGRHARWLRRRRAQVRLRLGRLLIPMRLLRRRPCDAERQGARVRVRQAGVVLHKHGLHDVGIDLALLALGLLHGQLPPREVPRQHGRGPRRQRGDGAEDHRDACTSRAHAVHIVRNHDA
mmetsp:Transcript_73226/g.212055  ORF Transcript_73226/g.212055 Transcript_73226/m.212055 type:complete len:207 (-) Transcript_73226:602-1222(-)